MTTDQPTFDDVRDKLRSIADKAARTMGLGVVRTDPDPDDPTYALLRIEGQKDVRLEIKLVASASEDRLVRVVAAEWQRKGKSP